jgi:hypothetical protein
LLVNEILSRLRNSKGIARYAGLTTSLAESGRRRHEKDVARRTICTSQPRSS